MKRYISLLLVAAVLITGLAMPANAVEFDKYDLLDYGFPIGLSSNSFNLDSDKDIVYQLPENSFVHYVDIVYTSYSNLLIPISAGYPGSEGLSLTVVSIGENLFRAYGYLPELLYDRIQFHLTSPVPWAAISFEYIHLYSNSLNVFDCPVTGSIFAFDPPQANFYYNSGSDYEGAIVYGTYDLDQSYRAYINPSDWVKYDYLDLQIALVDLSCTSISVYVGEQSIPFSVSYLNSESPTSLSTVCLSIDLTSINRSDSDQLEIYIGGNVPYLESEIATFAVIGSLGYVRISPPSVTVSFFNRLFNFFTDNFNSLNTWISNQTSSLTNSLASVGSQILTSAQSIVSSVSSLEGKLESWGQSIVTSVISFAERNILSLNNIYNNISNWGQNIVDALSPDTDSASSAVDKADQQAQQVQQNNDALQQMAKPDLSGSGDISGTTYPTNTVKYTLFLNHVMTAPIISEVLTLSLIFSLAAYVLFGKRG